MRLSEQEIIEKKTHILEASQACFIRKGFHNTTMQDICRQSEMSAGNIYRYFDSKERIIEAFAQEELQWLATAIGDVPSSPDLLQAIVDTIFWTTSTLMQDGKSELIAEFFAESGRNPRINAIYTKFNQQLIDEISRMLEDIENSSLLAPLHDKTSISLVIISLVDGLVLNKIISPNFDMMSMRPVIETMVSSLFAPLNPQAPKT